MDRLKAMSMLLTAVDAGSLSEAARRLDTPLATLSRNVSDLEAHLHTRLLTRSSRRIALTDAGRSYVAACRRILEEVSEAERAASGEYTAPRGDLTITAPIVFGRLHVLPIVIAFLDAYPEINIRLPLSDRIVHLVEDHIDLAVRIGELPDSSLMALRVGTIRQVVCASPEYLAKHGTPQKPDDLAAHRCVTFEGLMSPRAWVFRSGKKLITAPVRSRLSVSTAEAAIDAAVAGVGLTRVLSYQIAEARRAGALVPTLEAFEPDPWPVNLVYPSQGLLPLKLRAFLDFTAPRLRERLAANAA